ncbi:serine/threonine-protein kinase [Actinomycetospora sp. NBRC 106378]|uniref:serine/threonine-protein kinase n=1 Tax=Actinomycetospora sp. NBRC 106378 TaxID=3032208 RepID=UPI0024A5F7D9|nr:serine/threonine-protein kinase [Actinomycetospora sp. NBRC 106378]GLZ51368.1 hypothetical protein Acsp07_09850 [Actinomycetospora sp. NBRC 106378]
MQESWSAPGYTDIRELGRGASGRVVLAEHDATGTAVAVKYLADELRRDPGFLADFRHEAEVLASLDAPDVVRLWEYVQSAAGAAIVMDLIDGVTLRHMLDDRGPTAPESALCVLQGSLRGLGAAHTRGIVHRDYKPENVMVDADGRSHLTDFGLAAVAGRGVAGSGTAAYMAPEQWSGAPASAATDIYATTATFVECLTGRPPYPGPGVDRLRRQHENAPIPLDDVPAPVRELVTRGLAKDPAARPVDATSFLAELGSAAVAGYGADWEERGRRRLAERAALLALLFPLAAGAVGASAVATTTLGSAALGALAGNRLRILLGAGVAALLVGGATVATLASSGEVTSVAAAGVTGPGPVLPGTGGLARPAGGAEPASSPAIGGGAGSTPAILAGIFSPPGVPELTSEVAPADDTATTDGDQARGVGGGAGAPVGRGVAAGGAPVVGGGAPVAGGGAPGTTTGAGTGAPVTGGGVPVAGGAPGAGGGAPGTTTGAGTGAPVTGGGAPVGGGGAPGTTTGAGTGTGTSSGSGSGTGTTSGSGSGTGTTSGSGSGTGTTSGSGSGTGTTSGSGSGTGTTSGSGSGTGTTSGSGSGTGTTSGSGSGSGTTSGSGSGSGAGTSSGSGSGSSSGSGSDDPVDYGGCPGCGTGSGSGSGSGYGGIVR